MFRSDRQGTFFVALLAAGLAGLCVSRTEGTEPRVAGLNHLVVIPPGAHERGLPAVRTEAAGDGMLRVDIPPTLHVHRYYYCGDQEYQGPILEGGPTVVVANHPKTGERMYIDVTLPPGAPIIAYSPTAITYVYPDSRVAIHFSSLHPDRVWVKYHSGEGVLRRTQEIGATMRDHAKAHCNESMLWQSVRDSAAGTREFLAGTKTAVGSATSGLLDRVQQLGQSLPGVRAVRSLAGQQAGRANQAAIRAAERAKERATPEFVPTVR